jgi:hypothetical protein
MYFATLDPASGDLIRLRMVPLQIRKMRLNRATPHDASWLATRLRRISMHLGAWPEMAEDGDLFRTGNEQREARLYRDTVAVSWEAGASFRPRYQ